MVALNNKVTLVQSSPNLLNTTVEKNILVGGEASMQNVLNLVGLNNIADKECGPRGLGLTLE